MKKSISLLAFLILIVLFLLSCQKNSNTKPLGIVVASPEIAEIIYALQADDNIIGVTLECTYPPELQKKTIIGNFGQINLEKIFSLNPDIVFTTGLEQAALTENLHKRGIKTYSFYPKNLNELLLSITAIGKLINKEKEAILLTDSLRSSYANIVIPVQKPSVFVEIYNSPLMTVTDSSFVGNLVNKAGGINVFPVLARDYCRINPEEVIKANPDIIIITYPGVTAQDVKNRKGWQNIPACRNNQIYTINDLNPDLILRAGPRSIQGLLALNKLFLNTKPGE